MKLGIDVGGTHTDAVLVKGQEVIARAKMATTDDVAGGILAAAARVLDEGAISPADVEAVMVGTTIFTNSVIERRNLAPVVAIRIGGQSTASVPPCTDWPDDIRETLKPIVLMVDGGFEYDGSEIRPFDADALVKSLAAIDLPEGSAFAVTGVFAPLDNSQEELARRVLAKAYPAAPISISSDIGRLGIYQRENATLLNASLLSFASHVVDRFIAALKDLGVAAPVYISQNDGTLMGSDFVRDYPVLTFSSGPTNSMRGAAYLSRIKEAIVIDVGGTTSDIGMLVNGFPRESTSSADVGGVATNFRMPDVLAIGLGGGSIVRDNGRTIGPDSVGYRLSEEAMCFGGDVMTVTDIGVAAGLAKIGEPELVAAIPPEVIKTTLARLREMLETGIDRIKMRAGNLPVIAVGGGAFLVPKDLSGASHVIIPEGAGVANAIGAALSQVSGEAELLYSRSEDDRDQMLDKCKQDAREKAIKAGAVPESVEILELDEIPMSYFARPIIHLRVKAVGRLDI